MNDIKEYESMVKLRLPENERELISNYADILIRSFSELDKLDAGGAAPLVSVLDMTNIMRDDAAVKLISREELLYNAPEQYDGYFQVPKTLE